MIEWVVERFVGLLPTVEKMSSARQNKKDDALVAISKALNETYLYYRDIEGGKARNLETEGELSRLWAAAAIPLRHLDQELASVCEYKSEYWVNPDTWNDEKIKVLGIGLRKVRDDYRRLLAPKQFSKREN